MLLNERLELEAQTTTLALLYQASDCGWLLQNNGERESFFSPILMKSLGNLLLALVMLTHDNLK